MDANSVVDKVLASCYAYDHDVAHIGMTPLRWFPKIMSWILGEDNGKLGYAQFTEDLGRMISKYD